MTARLTLGIFTPAVLVHETVVEVSQWYGIHGHTSGIFTVRKLIRFGLCNGVARDNNVAKETPFVVVRHARVPKSILPACCNFGQSLVGQISFYLHHQAYKHLFCGYSRTSGATGNHYHHSGVCSRGKSVQCVQLSHGPPSHPFTLR